MIRKIFKVIKKKNQIAIDKWISTWKETPETYIEELKGEIKEVEEEMKKPWNMIHLEDELWDILWDYLNVLWLLDKEKKINKHRVIKKSYKKFKERIDAISEKWMNWKQIKEIQKKRLKNIHDRHYQTKSDKT